MIQLSAPEPMPFATITDEKKAADYYERLLGLTGRILVDGLEIDHSRLIRWLSPPDGILHLLGDRDDKAIETVCIIQNEEGRWLIWLAWETEGYGNTLVKALDKYPIEITEKQWLLTNLKIMNQAIDKSLKAYRHPIKFTPETILIH